MCFFSVFSLLGIESVIAETFRFFCSFFFRLYLNRVARFQKNLAGGRAGARAVLKKVVRLADRFAAQALPRRGRNIALLSSPAARLGSAGGGKDTECWFVVTLYRCLSDVMFQAQLQSCPKFCGFSILTHVGKGVDDI